MPSNSLHRHHRLFSGSLLLALSSAGCDGRYLLGNAPDVDVHVPKAGSGGSAEMPAAMGGSGTAGRDSTLAGAPDDDAPQLGGAGSGPVAAAGAGGSGDVVSGGAGAGGEGEPDPNPLGRQRWLALQTFPSSASSQTLLSLVDLQKRSWAGQVVESNSANDISPSPDQRWILYTSYPDPKNAELIDFYLVNTAGKSAGARQLLLEGQPRAAGCVWSPDGARLACSRRGTVVDSDALEVVVYGLSGSSLGPAVDLGPASSRPIFFGPTKLVYRAVDGHYLRRDLGADAPATPTDLGLSCDSLLPATDASRALCVVSSEPPAYTLLDVHSGQQQPLELSNPRFGSSYDVAVTWTASVDDDASSDGTYRYYAINGVEATLVGQTDASLPQLPYGPQIAGRSVAQLNGDKVVVTHVAPSGPATTLVVPGDYAPVQDFVLAPSGQSLYFETAEVEGGKLVDGTIEHFITQLSADGPSAPQQIARGFTGGSAVFSPDGKRLLLSGNTYYDDPAHDADFYLIDLSQTEAAARVLPLPLSWATAVFSRDSSYLSLIGGSLSHQARELYVIDALTADDPRLVSSCTSNPAALPGCPNYVVF